MLDRQGGGELHLGPGVFRVEGTLSLPDQLTLAGDGESTVIRFSNPEVIPRAIEAINRRNLTLQGITFEFEGPAHGEYLRFESCSRVRVQNCRLRETGANLVRWQMYQNLLAFLGCEDVLVEGCVFGEASNKHIHIGGIGTTQRVTIRGSEFFHSAYNCNPGPKVVQWASIYVYPARGTTSQDITIEGNHFHDNYLFSVTANNTSIADEPGIIRNLSIRDNQIEESSGGFIVQAAGVRIENNQLSRVGLSNILRGYEFVASQGLNRYQSLVRRDHSQHPASLPTTIVPSTLAVAFLGASVDAQVSGNRFSGCAEAQVMPPGQPASSAAILQGVGSDRLVVEANMVDDAGAAKEVLTPLVSILKIKGPCSLQRNQFQIPPQQNRNNPNILVRTNPGEPVAVAENRVS